MRLSLYTFVKNGIFYDYHVVEMLKHHLPLVDEIIVNEGYSTDGTYEAISTLDSKVKVFRSAWGKSNTFDWFLRFKNAARQRCTGDWCLLLDCDEFIPEWEFDRIRECIRTTKKLLIPIKLINFYGNYKVYNRHPEKVKWPVWKMTLHRNLPEMEVCGDGSNVRLPGKELTWDSVNEGFTCHHFGFVRNPARLREKWSNLQGNLHNNKKQRWLTIPSFLFNWWPHNWKDPQFLSDLALYEGPLVRAVRENPEEFVRDRFSLARYLQQVGTASLPGTA
jgi:glycosyltransferase involved in cell wall biosynthesis